MFKLHAPFSTSGDQPEAINSLVEGARAGAKDQVLLGVTGSGKTFTMANVINTLQMPTLIISHNKTLAGQLYQEMRDFYPDNAVSYFVSYYDFYQPEAYVPSSDTYIEKTADVNDKIDKLRLQATTNIMTRKDVIVVASVSCIYNIGDPREYGKFELPIYKGLHTDWKTLGESLIRMQYSRSEFEFSRGTFRLRGSNFDIYPAYQDTCYRVTIENGVVTHISEFEPISGKSLPPILDLEKVGIVIYPAKHYLLDQERFLAVEEQIRRDLELEYQALKKAGKNVEAQRLLQRTNYDLETMKEMGFVNGIENYSRYFDNRAIGERPYALPDYFRHAYGDNWLCIIDESHMTIPQIRGMYHGDQARKRTLVDFGFRLEAAMDNRPLKFEEFYRLPPRFIHVSATPDEWELEKSQGKVVEQLVRPTGIVDPEIIIRPAEACLPDRQGEIQDVISEIKKRASRNERVLVTTLTKKTAEDLTSYLKEQNIRASYLHSDIKTLERTDILDALRKNEFDALIGVNLLREGLDLPEVTLVAILDADREGFLRSRVSLIQTMGRAARNVKGEVILYADTVTDSMRLAINEIKRRREYQIKFNHEHNITPQTISKPLREKIIETEESSNSWDQISQSSKKHDLTAIDPSSLTPRDLARLIKRLEREMKAAADNLQFELAIRLRDQLLKLKSSS